MLVSQRSYSSFVIKKTLTQRPLSSLHQVSEDGALRCLRVFAETLVDSPERRERFFAAARTGSKLRAPQHVPLLAAGVGPDRCPWLLTEWLPGEDVGSLVRREGSLEPQLCRNLLAELGEYLGELHAAGLSHGYLKPENLQLVPGQRPSLRILDLTLGQLALAAEPQTRLNPSHMLLWHAPEQTTTGSLPGTATDIWTLGLLAFYVLTGRSYFLAAASEPLPLYDLLREVALADLPKASERAAALGRADRLPAGFDAWFGRCVVREPKMRFSSATEAVQQFLALWPAELAKDAPFTGTLAIGRHGIVELPEGFCFAGRCRVVRRLSEGGMGVLYEVEHLPTRARRALKLMKPQLLLDDRMRQRFIKEALLMARIASDHIAQVFDAGIDEATGMPWLLMELLDGEDLAALTLRSRGFGSAEAIEILSQLCDALAAAHTVGIVHRDLKPENVFVGAPRRAGQTMWVALLDFGIAKVLSESLTVAVSSRLGSLGTPLWMAPEQADARSTVTPATDVWALGLLGFFLLTGVSYWSAAHGAREPTMGKLLREVLAGPIVPASERAADYGLGSRIPAGFDAWFKRCVARRPEDRFASAIETLAALREALAERPAEPPSAPTAALQTPGTPVTHFAPTPPTYAPAPPYQQPEEISDRRMNPWWLVTVGALALCVAILLVALLSAPRAMD